MPIVAIPALMRKLTDGEEHVSIPGTTLRDIIDNLERRYPGIQERLCEEGRVKPGIAVYINGILTREGLREHVDTDAEIHFLPAISGGIAVSTL